MQKYIQTLHTVNGYWPKFHLIYQCSQKYIVVMQQTLVTEMVQHECLCAISVRTTGQVLHNF